MKLEKALEINTHIAKIKAFNNRQDEEQAVKLGNEALKRVQLARKEFGYIDPSLLPGEEF